MLDVPFTLRQLDVFSCLTRTKSFRLTAEELGISQASVSGQIKSLEQQMGVQFLDRSPGRRPVLLPAGDAFLADLKVFEDAVAMLAAHRRDLSQRQSKIGHFRVLAGQGMLDTFVRRKLDQFYAKHPDVELEFDARLPFGSVVQEVVTGGYDFALINQRCDRPKPTGFTEIARFRGGIYGHIRFLDGRNLPLTIDEINKLPFILPTATSKQDQEVMTAYRQLGIEPRHIAGYTQYYDVIGAMLERGLGVASFSDALLTTETRDTVVLLYPMQDWRLLWYRQEKLVDSISDEVEAFLLDCIINDPACPRVKDATGVLSTR